MLDWVSLRFIENAPSSVYAASAIIAVLMLAVIESRDWLNFKGRWYFRSFFCALLVIYCGIIGFSYVRFEWYRPETIRAAIIKNPFIDWNGGSGPMILRAKYNQTGEKLAVFIHYGSTFTSGKVINWFYKLAVENMLILK
jgi:hypothetical protein